MELDLARDEVALQIDAIVEEILAEAGLTSPPVDAIALAQRHLGILVGMDRRQQARGRAQRTAGRRQIFLRPEPSEERHQWTVAHEIGEHLKTLLLRRLGITPDDVKPMTGESLANLFSYRLLAPTRWFAPDARQVQYDLPQLKARYRTASHELLALRLLDLPAPCIITIIDNGAVHKRRSNAYRVNKELRPVEVECQQQVTATGESARLARDGWIVQGWPVHANNWKREILRSESTDEGTS